MCIHGAGSWWKLRAKSPNSTQWTEVKPRSLPSRGNSVGHLLWPSFFVWILTASRLWSLMVITDNSKFFKSKVFPVILISLSQFDQFMPLAFSDCSSRYWQAFKELTMVYAFSWTLYVRISSFSFIPHGSISPHSLPLVLLWLIRVLLLWCLQVDKIIQCVCEVGNTGCKTEWRNLGLVWVSPNPGSSSSWLHGCSGISTAKEEEEAKLPLRTTNI